MYPNSIKRSGIRGNLSEEDYWLANGISSVRRGQYTLSERDRPQRIWVSISQDELVIEQEDEKPAWLVPVAQAMSEIMNLPVNWDSYGALSVRPTAIHAALELLFEIMQADTPAPTVVPTVQGGVQLEWHTHGIDLEIEILSPGRLFVYYEDHEQQTEWEGEITADLTRLSEVLFELSRRVQNI